MLEFPDVTLVTCSNVNIAATVFAMEHSLKLAKFKAAKFITNGFQFDHLEFDVIQEPRLKDYDSYSEVMLFELHKYIDTKFCLVIQADGFILNPNKWSDSFLEYDYIGACVNTKSWSKKGVKVGNGGFSLRSEKILNAPREYFGSEKAFRNYFNYYREYGPLWEDFTICVTAGDFYRSKGIKFATESVASQFSVEPYNFNNPKETFGFHYGNIFNMLC